MDKPEKVIVRELRGQLLPYGLGAPSDYRGQERNEHESHLRELLVKASNYKELDDFLLAAEEWEDGIKG